MAKEILYMLMGFLAGCMFCVIVSAIGDAVRRHSNRHKNREVDNMFDTTNYINQKQHYWEPFQADDEHVLYRLH